MKKQFVRGKSAALLGWMILMAGVCMLPEGETAAANASGTERIILAQGRQKKLGGKKQKKAVWKSQNPSVAIVDDNGTVTALLTGAANIEMEKNGKTNRYKVIVRKGIASDRKIRQGNGRWRKLNGRKYYLLEDGSMAVGARKINDSVYIFDENGILQAADERHVVQIDGEKYYAEAGGKAISGWHIINKKLYYTNYHGKILKDRVIEGIRLSKNGAAQKSREQEWQWEICKAVDKVTTDKMTKEKKLRACWDYLTSRDNFSYGGSDPNLREKYWWKKAAGKMLASNHGNCYYFASAFAAMAHTLGYKAYVISGEMWDYGGRANRSDGMISHCWTMIDGKYYDPELCFVGFIKDIYASETYEKNEPYKILQKIKYAD